MVTMSRLLWATLECKCDQSYLSIPKMSSDLYVREIV